MTHQGTCRRIAAALAGSMLFLAAASPSAGAEAGPQPAAKPDAKPDDPAFVPLFNGKDLTGWKPTGSAEWFVEDGCLVGTQTTGKGGDLFTEAEYDNFELRVVYRVKWPANTGFWFRFGQSAGYQYDVLKYKRPVAFSGSLYCHGKMFLTRNEDESLESRDGWNEARVWANGDEIILWLNGHRVGAVRDKTFAKGRFGLQVHGGGGFKGMRVVVKEFAMRAIGPDEKPPADQPVPASAPAAAKLKAVLWVGGHSHDFKAYADILTKALPKRVPTDIEVVRDGKFLDLPQAGQLDVIVMNHCFDKAEGVLTDAQKAKLLALIRGGVGVVGVHASYYSFTKWAEIRSVWGTTFTRHGAVNVTLVVTILDKEHPIARGVGDSFEVRSELYQSTPLAKDCHLIAKAKEKGKDAEYPSVWTRMEGKGRVVAIMPAHWPDAYKVPAFVELIANAMKWAARQPPPAEGAK